MLITNEDNMKLMARYEDNYFDLAIVDPPYGIGVNKGGHTLAGNGNFKGGNFNVKATQYVGGEWDNERPNKEYFFELLRVSKNVIIWGGNYFSDLLPSSSCWIVWDKKNEGTHFADCELAWSNMKTAVRKYRIHKFDATRGGKDCIHPTQKPVKLYEWLLMNYAKEGDKILDTHLGSGSIAIACYNLGYELTACELDTEYYKAAMKRIEQHKQQLRIF